MSYIETIIQGIRGIIGEGLSSAEGFELSRLEGILRKTGWLVRRRNVVPKSEADIREVMHDYLGAFFADYTKNIAIAKPIKTFIPDGGVTGLKAAIEFKFATSEEQVKQELGGIYEDMVGYQTEEFVAEDAFREAIIRGGHGVWTPILRMAPGRRKMKKKKKSSRKRP